ncbi:hypothetical protein BCR34DRAFT_564044 [Clohesyomyces aquaticus]|uniref:Uncharacterized protein n=1 Tax=Clohesyomyces aquaticus TaxID=1231657 RepID=A0A1Y1ZPP3_9PLEO|nr:hypothetical protein BCR34DRAFT_564044 [Clohesyomyces aquaticus]
MTCGEACSTDPCSHPGEADRDHNALERCDKSPPIPVRFVYKSKYNGLRCKIITINPSNQGEDLLRNIATIRMQAMGRLGLIATSCSDAFYMRRDIVCIVSISLCSSIMFVEEGTLEPRVYIKQREYLDYLTRAFDDPGSLKFATNLVSDHLEGTIDSGSRRLLCNTPRQALFVSKSLDKTASLIWFTFALILSGCLGIGVGVGNVDAGLGFAAGGGLLAVFASVQCVLLWQGRLSEM